MGCLGQQSLQSRLHLGHAGRDDFGLGRSITYQEGSEQAIARHSSESWNPVLQGVAEALDPSFRWDDGLFRRSLRMAMFNRLVPEWADARILCRSPSRLCWTRMQHRHRRARKENTLSNQKVTLSQLESFLMGAADNHTPRFWNIVRSRHPAMERARDWLRENGQSLEEDV